MIVRDFNLVGIPSLPVKAHPVLFVYPNAMLLTPVASQTLESISRRDRQVPQVTDPIDLVELPPGDSPQRLGASPPGRERVGSIEDVLCPAIPE